MKHDLIPRADADVIARRIVEAVTAHGGSVEELELHPHPRGLVIFATIFGRVVAVLCTSYSIVAWDDVGKAIMTEASVGLNPTFRDDADVIGLH
jgi:hypothetical protein